MATLTPGALTLAEQMKQIGPGGNLLEVVNVLAQYNELDIDAPYVMANDRFTDVSSRVISLPSIGNRRINRGAAGGVGRTEQHREFIEIMEARPYIDTLLLDSEPDGGTQARLNQIGLFIEAMAQGHRVELRGFGAFSVKKRDARQGRNPRTGDAVTVEEKYVPFFKTGKLLRDRLNGIDNRSKD